MPPRPIYDLLLKGQNLLIKGNKGSYQVAKSLQKFVFKGDVHGSSGSVIIKAENHPVSYAMEVNAYQFQCIRKSPYIRSLHEVIDNSTDKCMVFEWMDCDLWSLRQRQNESSRNVSLMGLMLSKVVAKSVLKAFIEFENMDGQGPGVHTDVNPNNILVSGADTPSPIVKIADLGGLIRAGKPHKQRFQGLEIRAPEIWKRAFSSPACDMWSLGVTLTHYLAGRCIFGASDMNIQIASRSHESTQAAWCIGKITKLVGPLTRDEDPEFKDEFDVAEILVKQSHIKVASLEEKLGNLPKDCVQFIRHLLTLDPKRRLTAEQALKHPWLENAQ